jgi:aspartate-semialdehyde dehydrogenase
LADRPKVKVALVGSESLLGREIRDLAVETAPELDLRLIAAEEGRAGLLTALGDEPALVTALDADNLSGVRAIILAGSEASSRRALELAAGEPDAAIIDLTFAAEELLGARLRAPAVELEPDEDGGAVHIVAHPAAIALALFLRRLHAHDPIRRSVIHILAPASERGAEGIEELQAQTVSLLSFKSLPKAIFDAQLAFSLLARYGDQAPTPLDRTAHAIERHLAALLELPGEGEGAPMPSLGLIQAPVFHGYSFSAWVELESNPGIEGLESGLACEWIDVRGADAEPPDNVGNAGQPGIAVGGMAEDSACPDACWFWMVADNLKLAAENAVAVARGLA